MSVEVHISSKLLQRRRMNERNKRNAGIKQIDKCLENSTTGIAIYITQAKEPDTLPFKDTAY